MQFVCIFFHLLNICRKFEFLIFQGSVAIATCLRSGGLCCIGFLKQISCAFQQFRNFWNRLRFDKVTWSSKVGTFLRHSVDLLPSRGVAKSVGCFQRRLFVFLCVYVRVCLCVCLSTRYLSNK